jgi:hypothetical protein
MPCSWLRWSNQARQPAAGEKARPSSDYTSSEELSKLKFLYPTVDSSVVNDNVLYHSLSALASAEVNFWFTCRRKRLVARADGCGERCGMTFLATWASAYI